MARDAAVYRDLAERAWSWVRTMVRSNDDGLWLPERPDQDTPGEYPYGMHSGVGGLAHVLAEIRLTRDLSGDEQALGRGIAATVAPRIAEETEFDYFDGLVSTLGILIALDGALDQQVSGPGAERSVARLRELATADGWQPSWIGPPRAVAEGRCNDATLGNAAVLQGAIWARRYDVPGADALAAHALEVVLAEKEETAVGLDWPFVPRRFVVEDRAQMPNWSHGLAGIAGTLAAAGAELGRPDVAEAARLGAEHLVTLADTSDGGMRVPHIIPGNDDLDTYTYSWCHGPTGTSLLFAALAHAGADGVAGRTPYDWERACLHSVKVSGVPERGHPGFWDNDGRCCGTAGVGDVVLNLWQRHGIEDDLDFAVVLADAIADRAVRDGDHVYWRFVEHRNEDPLLPPGPGYMQGAAGIAAYLFRLARVLEHGRGTPAVPRMDTWWALAA